MRGILVVSLVCFSAGVSLYYSAGVAVSELQFLMRRVLACAWSELVAVVTQSEWQNGWRRA